MRSGRRCLRADLDLVVAHDQATKKETPAFGHHSVFPRRLSLGGVIGGIMQEPSRLCKRRLGLPHER